MAISKVIYGGTTLIDLTADSVTANKILVDKTTGKGYTAHGADGEPITGTCTFDADTSDATALEAEILQDRTAYNKGNKITGKMPNKGAVTGRISDKNEPYNIPQGYHDGGGTVDIDAVSKGNLIEKNIRQGVSILGVTGTMTGAESVKIQANKDATPSVSNIPQIIKADDADAYLAQVTVMPIPYVESENSAGGMTVTIG